MPCFSLASAKTRSIVSFTLPVYFFDFMVMSQVLSYIQFTNQMISGNQLFYGQHLQLLAIIDLILRHHIHHLIHFIGDTVD